MDIVLPINDIVFAGGNSLNFKCATFFLTLKIDKCQTHMQMQINANKFLFMISCLVSLCFL